MSLELTDSVHLVSQHPAMMGAGLETLALMFSWQGGLSTDSSPQALWSFVLDTLILCM